jgi:hypothetical protein
MEWIPISWTLPAGEGRLWTHEMMDALPGHQADVTCLDDGVLVFPAIFTGGELIDCGTMARFYADVPDYAGDVLMDDSVTHNLTFRLPVGW